MGKAAKKILKEELNRLKRSWEKLVRPKKDPVPQLVLQPVRNRKY